MMAKKAEKKVEEKRIRAFSGFSKATSSQDYIKPKKKRKTRSDKGTKRVK